MALFTIRLHTTGRRLTLGIMIATSLTSCIATNGEVSHTANHEANNMVVIGVPMLFGGFGSSVPVNTQYHVTAKHVARLSWDLDVIHHPYCDLSLVRTNSHVNEVPNWGLIYTDQAVTHQGHSLLGTSIKGDGKYIQDVLDTNSKCLYSLSDAPAMSGMSGGPVFNDKGEIVGITVAIMHNPEDISNLRHAERYTQFVPATLIFDWLNQLGVDTSFATPDLASIEVAPYIRKINQTPFHSGNRSKSYLAHQTHSQQANTEQDASISVFNHYAIVEHAQSYSSSSAGQATAQLGIMWSGNIATPTINTTQKQGDNTQKDKQKSPSKTNTYLINEIGYRPSYW